MENLQRKELLQKINNCLDLYKFLNKKEYEDALDCIRSTKEKQKDEGRFDKKHQVMEKLVVSYPESFLKIMMKNLGKEEMGYLSTREGIDWFAKNFKQFKI